MKQVFFILVTILGLQSAALAKIECAAGLPGTEESQMTRLSRQNEQENYVNLVGTVNGFSIYVYANELDNSVAVISLKYLDGGEEAKSRFTEVKENWGAYVTALRNSQGKLMRIFCRHH